MGVPVGLSDHDPPSAPSRSRMIQVMSDAESAEKKPPRNIGVNPEELLALPTSARYRFFADI